MSVYIKCDFLLSTLEEHANNNHLHVLFQMMFLITKPSVAATVCTCFWLLLFFNVYCSPHLLLAPQDIPLTSSLTLTFRYLITIWGFADMHTF